MRVRAKRQGYIYDRRVREGEEFELKKVVGRKKLSSHSYEEIILNPEDQFSENWMEKLDEAEEKEAAPKKKKPAPKPKKAEVVDEEVI